MHPITVNSPTATRTTLRASSTNTSSPTWSSTLQTTAARPGATTTAPFSAFSAKKSYIPRWNGRYQDRFRLIGGRRRIVERTQLSDYPMGYRPADDVRPR